MKKNVKIGNKIVGENKPCYIIAEAGSNHNGILKRAKKLIDVAANAGANAVKFQSLNFNELYTSKAPQKIKKLFNYIEFPEKWHYILSDYAKKKNIHFLSSPTYVKAVDILKEIDVNALKLGSAQTATDHTLIQYASKTKLPLILSMGLLSLNEIKKTVNLVNKYNPNIIILHCKSQYPTDPNFANLGFINTLKKSFNCPIGYSDHTTGIHFPIAAVALGANVIEKHFTLSRNMEGPDHSFAIEPNELCEMIQNIREIEKSLNDKYLLPLTTKEKAFFNDIKLKAIAKRDLQKGNKLMKSDFMPRRVKNGIEMDNIDNFIGLNIMKNIKKNAPLERKYFKK